MEAVTPENTRKHPFRVSPDSLRTPENTLSPFRGRVKTGVGTGPGVLLVPYLLAAPPATVAALVLLTRPHALRCWR
jgi:hypothetical protein